MKIEYFLTGLTIIVGFLVAYVAYNQFVLAKEKFKLDLFEKRFAIYKGTQRFLSSILREGNVTMEMIYQFRAETQDSIFLFEDDIKIYLKEIDRKALDLWLASEKMREEPVGDKRSKLAENENELLGWLIAQLPKLKDIFSPYLRFKTWK